MLYQERSLIIRNSIIKSSAHSYCEVYGDGLVFEALHMLIGNCFWFFLHHFGLVSFFLRTFSFQVLKSALALSKPFVLPFLISINNNNILINLYLLGF